MKNAFNKITINPLYIDYNPPKISFGGISLSRDEFPVTIKGANGFGKSSLTLALSGVIPDYINASIPNIEFFAETDAGKIDLMGNKNFIQIIPQRINYGLLGFTAIDEINLVKVNNIDFKKELLEYFEISKLKNIPSSYLSDGEKKRLIICISLLSEKPLIISDEWETHLDKYWINKINHAFNSYYKKGGLHLSLVSNCYNNNGTNVIELDSKLYPVRKKNVFRSNDSTDYITIFNEIVKSNTQNSHGLSTNIYYSFTEKKHLFIKVLQGEFICLIGPNGSGKTTVLRKIWDKSNSRLKKYFYTTFRKEILSKSHFIPTDPIYHILGPTIKDEILRISRDDNFVEKTSQLLSVILQLNTDVDVLSLSYGQRKLLAITLGLLNFNEVLLIDEPFAGLDDFNLKLIQDLLVSSSSKGKVIVITNQSELESESKKIYL